MPAVQKAATCLDVDIFCRVIDNFGDAGVMWRLARALRAEGYAVRLIIDDPSTLCALAGCASQTPTEKIGSDESIEVCLWKKDWDTASCPRGDRRLCLQTAARLSGKNGKNLSRLV